MPRQRFPSLMRRSKSRPLKIILSDISFVISPKGIYFVLAVFFPGKRNHRRFFQAGSRTSLMPLMGCMSARNATNRAGAGPTHAWSIILKFYDMKQGREYNSAPARKLSQSFGLDLTGSTSNTKQSMLTAVGQILASHAPYKRSLDAQFKAFVCAGLK